MTVPLNQDALFISNEEVVHVSDMESYIQIVEQAYADYGEKKTINFHRQNLWVPLDDQHRRSLKLMAAATPGNNILGAYVYSGGYGHSRGWQKCSILYDFNRGNLKAVIESEHLSWLKTGSVSAVAAKYLSRKDAKKVGIFGAGKQAVTQLEGLCKVRQIETIKVFSLRDSSKEEFCKKMNGKLGIDVIPAHSPQEAIRGSDIVVAATTSKFPVFDGRWLEEGVHVNAIGAHYPEIRELDEYAIRGHKVVVDTMDSLKECGEFCLSNFEERDIYAELGDVVARKKLGRMTPTEITVFKSGGRGFEYLALANYVYQKVVEKT